MPLLLIKYKLHGKMHKTRVSYHFSAGIIAGLLLAGATIRSATQG